MRTEPLDLLALAGDSSREVSRELFSWKGGRLEHIVSTGQSSPPGFWYDQEEDEWVCLLQGEAVLELESRQVPLRRGESFFLPAHCRHRVASTSSDPPAVWLCVFFRLEKT